MALLITLIRLITQKKQVCKGLPFSVEAKAGFSTDASCDPRDLSISSPPLACDVLKSITQISLYNSRAKCSMCAEFHLTSSIKIELRHTGRTITGKARAGKEIRAKRTERDRPFCVCMIRVLWWSLTPNIDYPKMDLLVSQN